MNKKIYTVFDRKAGTYCRIFDSCNDDVAMREFNQAYNSAGLKYLAQDMELYTIGEIDYEHGFINAFEKPIFVGGVIIGE